MAQYHVNFVLHSVVASSLHGKSNKIWLIYKSQQIPHLNANGGFFKIICWCDIQAVDIEE